MAKGTKQIRMGRVEQYKRRLEYAIDAVEEFKDDEHIKPRVWALNWAMKMLLEEFPELKTEDNSAL